MSKLSATSKSKIVILKPSQVNLLKKETDQKKQ